LDGEKNKYRIFVVRPLQSEDNVDIRETDTELDSSGIK
jgi:hypothetical protein